MNGKRLVTSVFLVLCTIGVVTWKSYGNNEPAQSAKQKWEYLMLSFPATRQGEAKEKKELNAAGNDGWELVGFTSEQETVTSLGRTEVRKAHVFYLKRLKI